MSVPDPEKEWEEAEVACCSVMIPKNCNKVRIFFSQRDQKTSVGLIFLEAKKYQTVDAISNNCRASLMLFTTTVALSTIISVKTLQFFLSGK